MQRDKILLIDGHNMFLRNWSVIPTMDENGNHNGGTLGFLRSLKKLVNENFPMKIIVCWEGKHSVKRRRKLHEGYKANRGIPKRVNRAYQLETPDEQLKSLKRQLFRTKDYLEHFPVYQLGVEYTEADDVIGHISRNLYPENEKIIISNDKDFLQLINDKVTVYRPATKQHVDVALMLEIEDVHPANWLLFKAFKGDKSDNIPGIKGIGVKTLIKMFPMLKEEHNYTLDEILSIAKTAIDEGNKLSKKYQLIIDNREIVELNYELMKLTETNISLKAISTINDQLKVQRPTFDAFKLRVMFTKDGARDQVQNFDWWTRAFMPLVENSK
tara:strand:- start:107 stop:1090 length:984 start_codon:yes stop_codon:yes gene_type:complete